MNAFPWITIPKFARPGQTHAFADRTDQLAYLYRMLANAGNLVRGGAGDVSLSAVVHGYVGVGKSALILEALGLLRGELVDAVGQRLAAKKLLPDPIDIQQWLVMYVSGKRVSDVDALAGALQQAAATEGASPKEQPRDPLAGIFSPIHEQAARQVAPAIQVKILHRLLEREEAKIRDEIRAALRALGQEIERTRDFAGGFRTETLKESETAVATSELKGHLTAGGSASATATNAQARAGADVEAGASRKQESSRSYAAQIERQSRVTSERLVIALNKFFAATRRARIPTILVIDDFDEVTSSVGSSRHDRSLVLSAILGPFTQLTPTCLILGLRDEYMHEDIERVADSIYVPPLTRQAARDALSAWAEVQEPALPPEQVEALQGLGDRFYRRFGEDEPIVVPFQYLQFVAWLANNAGGADKSDAEWLLLYLQKSYSREAIRLIQRVVERMSDEDMRRAAECAPLDPTPFALASTELDVLLGRLLARPASAGDPTDKRIVLDPIFSLLRAAIMK